MTLVQNSNQALVFRETMMDGVFLIERKQRLDSRGLFERIYDDAVLAQCGWIGGVAQVNHSSTLEKGALRGMHYQAAPFADWKLVTCMRGEVWDVVVDLRMGSPTFLNHFGCSLSAENSLALLLPPGCAHGFQTLCTEVDMIYCHSQPYVPEYDCGLNALDPSLQIQWPIEITQRSSRDMQFPNVTDDFKGV